VLENQRDRIGIYLFAGIPRDLRTIAVATLLPMNVVLKLLYSEPLITDNALDEVPN
jgi:hypothetical protein